MVYRRFGCLLLTFSMLWALSSCGSDTSAPEFPPAEETVQTAVDMPGWTLDSDGTQSQVEDQILYAIEAEDASANLDIIHSYGDTAPGPESVPDVFAAVLRGKSNFVLYEKGVPISIDEVPSIISPYDSYMRPQRYTVVDLLGNGTPEVLIYVVGVANDMSGYLLLWDEDGQVNGEIFDRHGWRNRWFIDLKADGSFVCTDSLGGHGWSSISTLQLTAEDGWTLYSHAVCRITDSALSANEIDLESLMVVEREITEKEFDEALETQKAKTNVTWYELPLKTPDGDPAV